MAPSGRGRQAQETEERAAGQVPGGTGKELPGGEALSTGAAGRSKGVRKVLMPAFLGDEFGYVKEARHFENSLGRKPDHLPRPGSRDFRNQKI